MYRKCDRERACGGRKGFAARPGVSTHARQGPGRQRPPPTHTTKREQTTQPSANSYKYHTVLSREGAAGATRFRRTWRASRRCRCRRRPGAGSGAGSRGRATGTASRWCRAPGAAGQAVTAAGGRVRRVRGRPVRRRRVVAAQRLPGRAERLRRADGAR